MKIHDLEITSIIVKCGEKTLTDTEMLAKNEQQIRYETATNEYEVYAKFFDTVIFK